jgi:hypothetical protein
MNRTATEPNSILQGLPLSIQSRERWQQGGMNVDDSPGERSDEGFTQDTHVSCQNHQINPKLLTNPGQLLFIKLAVGKLAGVYVAGRNASQTGFFQHGGLFPVRDHHLYNRRELLAINLTLQSLKI